MTDRLPTDLISRLETVKVEEFQDSYDESPRPSVPLAEANAVTSKLKDDGRHAILLDLDVPAWLVPSSTPGHSHLYIDVKVEPDAYFHILNALACAGVIELGFADLAIVREATTLRLPWVKKNNEGEA